MPVKLLSFDEALKQRLKDKKFKKSYDQARPKVEIGYKIVQLRHKLGLTQKQLADKIHTSQTVVSRLESGSYWQCSLRTLDKIAVATGTKLEVNFKG